MTQNIITHCIITVVGLIRYSLAGSSLQNTRLLTKNDYYKIMVNALVPDKNGSTKRLCTQAAHFGVNDVSWLHRGTKATKMCSTVETILR